MNIHFNKLVLNNFLSFENAELDFSQKGFTLVEGVNNYVIDNSSSNGSGKSSIWDAISWCLTGETIRGTKSVKRINSDGKCFVELQFNVDESEYKLIRESNPSKLFFYKNGEDTSGKGIRDTEKILSQHFPDLTSMLIGSVIILGQGLPQKFSSNTPSGRKEILEKLSKSDFMIEDIKTRISNRKNNLNESLQQNNNEKISVSTSLTNSEKAKVDAEQSLNSLTSVESYESTLNSYRSELTSTEETWQKLVTEEDSYENELQKISEQIEELRIKRDDTVKVMESEGNVGLQELQKDIFSIESEVKSVGNEINRIRNIKDVCPTCGQKIPNVIKPSTQSLEKTLEDLNIELSSKKDVYNKQLLEVNTRIVEEKLHWNNQINELKDKTVFIKDEVSKLKTDISTTRNKLASLKDNIFSVEKIIAEYQSKINIYNEIIDKASIEIKSCNDRLLYINDVIDNLKKHLEVINKFETCVKRDFRGYLLCNIINYINLQSKEYCKYVFNTDKIQFTLDGNNISISYNEKEYECLSGGERQKVDIIVQFALRDMLCKYLNFSSNILVLDEITDNLDSIGCQNIFNLISSKLLDVENIYIISHHTELQFPVDYQLIINKGVDGISRIQ